jgi:hypothetical protein
MPRPLALAWAALVCLVAAMASTPAHANLVWGPKRGTTCETPNVFYSPKHVSGMQPCCPIDDGVCPGATSCPVNGVCIADGTKCVPTPVARPNVVLVISDDQGECHYGSAKECRSVQSGTPIPAPVTPAVDALAAAGTVFPIAHNTASWCYPSLNSILTGRYQKSFGGFRSGISEHFLTIPRVMRQLGRAPGTVKDPFDPDASIGGYCTIQGGKFTASSGRDNGFDARIDVGERKLGRLDCRANPQGGQPLCGTDMAAQYAPFALERMRDVLQFIDSLVYRNPAAPGTFTMQQFFAWYAPRIPHQPLRAPEPIETYLFGADGKSGFFQLGQLCAGANCPPAVHAFDETNFGSVRDYYANVYLVDSNVRELRDFLAALSAPHCIGGNGQSRFQETTPAACHGTWATGISPDPAGNTIFVYLSDNGWQLPNSKHNFSENGYRTRLIVYDPRNPTTGAQSDALAHSTDVLPSLLGYALDTPPGSEACPTSDFDGTACDGRDLRAQLGATPAAATDLRHSLCGHETRRPVRPSRGRYLLTTPGTVGRCTLTSGAACVSDLTCGGGEFCLGGHCVAQGGKPCGSSASCAAGSICLAGKCQAGPPCVDDATCTGLLGPGGACVAKEQKWCANAPDVACTTRTQCPECPSINGREIACRRLCQPRMLKMYDNGFNADMTDLFLDPDETDLKSPGANSVAAILSNEAGPYGGTIQQFACCLDDWWSEFATGALCGGGSCPAALTCNQ